MLKVLELFSGIGAQHKALTRLGVSAEFTQCEIDKYAIQSYNAIHGETKNLGDITKINENDLYKDQWDLITYSFPCFTGDSLVLTDKGYKQIKDIKIGDKVITHTKEYKQVLNVFNNGLKDIIKIKGMGIDEIKCTPNHKFYVREMYRKGHKAIRCFKEPIWKEAKNLTKKDYLGIPINNKSIIPNWEGIIYEWKDGRKSRYKNELSKYMDNKDWWWLVGRYLGDGWLREGKSKGIVICSGFAKSNSLKNILDKLKIKYYACKERTVDKYHIIGKEYNKFFQQFNKGAKNKELTNTIFDLPIELLKSFLEGYFSANGYFNNKNNYQSFNSISRKLIYGIAYCCCKVYHRSYSITKENRPNKHIIENRLVNQNQGYLCRFKKENGKQDKAFYEDGYIWYPIRSIENFGKDIVYDLEVADNHSFTIQNTIVHNCQAISQAGLQKGLTKNSGTTSSLLWEVEKFIKKVKPKYLLMENVKALVGKKFINDFSNWLNLLNDYGYNNYWQVLNAKDYGIPQNRERVFCVSIRKDLRQGYEFPKKEPLKIFLSDLLEKEVDEKYYLSDKMLNCFLKDTGDSFNRKDRFLSSLKSVQKNDVALTITTRAGSRSTDNFIGTYQFAKSDNFMNGKNRLQINKNISDTLQTSQKEAVVFSKMETTTNLKTQLCNKLIEENKVKPFDIVKHSYSNNRLKEKRRIVENNNSNLAITLTTRADTIGVVVPTIDQLRIRKLTPLECFLLMGFDKEDYEKVKAIGISNAQMYKIMGNSIVVNVLEKIFYNLLIDKKEFDRLF